MRIAVYSIAKNEEQFVERWLKSAADADFILLADTGSTDYTREKFVANLHGQTSLINININPWRFEDARNASLAAIPADIDFCIALDLDEVLRPGWRESLEALARSCPDATRLRYNYIWSMDSSGAPGLTYHGDKIHRRNGYRWVNPVHEVLSYDARLGAEVQAYTNDTWIEHHPDNTKSRSQYLDLLRLATMENPYNDRNAHYYARDLMYAQQYYGAIDEFKRHLELPNATWKPERSASMRYLGDCYFALGNYDEALYWFSKAINEAPELREPWIARAQFHRFQGNWYYVMQDVNRALAIKDKPNIYINEASSWNGWPEQMRQEAINNMELDL